MGKKGVKKKTRWRTLSISTPQPEEEESERVRNSYETSGRNYEKNSYINNGNARSQRYSTYHNRNNHSTTSSKIPKDEDSESSGNQQKYIFNEEEYTRITTPRQDVLFKKGYLTQKKPWTSLSSTSATPSTTESQSASHSTADGSETIEDQQLLDMNPGEYNSMTDPVPQLNYATYYNHAGGYYHECPMMLVGPVIPDPTVSNVITTMPCAPVPMGPIEWFNPGYPAKVGSPQQCLLDYHAPDCATLVDHEEISTNISTMYNGHGMITDRDGSCTGSIEKDNQIEECIDYNEELLEDGSIIEDPYMTTMAAHQMHMTHMIPQPVTSSYCYSGHYLVGPMIMNTNGMPIQSDPTLRCDDAMSSSVEQVCTKRKKKRKKKKTKRQSTIANGEDEDEDEYSSEYETYVSSVKPPWALNEIPANKNNQSLNPNCQEFQYQPTYVDYNNVTDNFNDESSNSNSISPSIFTPMESNSSLSTDNATEIDEKKISRRMCITIIITFLKIILII